MKIFFRSVVLLVLISLGAGNTFAAINTDTSPRSTIKYIGDSEYSLTTKQLLLKEKNGQKYVNIIDNFIKKLSSDEKKLILAKQKIDTYLAKTAIANPTLKLVLEYLQEELSSAVTEIQSSVTNTKVSEMLTGNIEKSEQEKVEKNLVDLQMQLYDSLEDNITVLEELFTKYTNVEERGDFEFDLQIDQDSIGSINSNIKIEDYIAKSSGFDASFVGKLKTVINAVPKGEDEVKAEINTIVDFIQKDENLYLLLKNFHVTNDKGIEDIKELLSKLEKLGEGNKYINITDENRKEFNKILKTINIAKIKTDMKASLSKSFFTAYKKEGTKYLLKPTKESCNYKKFFEHYSYNGVKKYICSDEEYKEFLEEFALLGDIYVRYENGETIFGQMKNDSEVNIQGEIAFSKNSISSAFYTVIPDQTEYPNEKLVFNYKKNKSVSFLLRANSENINISSNLNLDANNTVTSGNIIAKIKDSSLEINIVDRELTGAFTLLQKGYSYNESTKKWGQQLTSTIKGTITGTLKGNNFEALKITYTGTKAETKKEFIKGKVEKNGNRFTLKNYYEGNYNTVNFDLSTNIDEYFLPYDGYVKFTLSDTTSLSPHVDMALDFEGRKVTGHTFIFDNNKEKSVEIYHTGEISKERFELQNHFNLKENPFTYMSKARDSLRVSNMQLMSMQIEMYNTDNGNYPSKEEFLKLIESYKIKDPLGNVEIDTCKFGFTYNVFTDKNGIKNGAYKLTTCLEQSNYGKDDGGVISNRYEKFAGVGAESFNKDLDFIQNYRSWKKQEKAENKKVSGDINFLFSNSNNTILSDINVKIFENTNEVIKMRVYSKATRNYEQNIQIEAPEESIPLSEVMGTKY